MTKGPYAVRLEHMHADFGEGIDVAIMFLPTTKTVSLSTENQPANFDYLLEKFKRWDPYTHSWTRFSIGLGHNR